MLNNKSVLITGGTGSFGKAFTKTILDKYPDVKRLIIFSRDELKQFEMSQTFSETEYPALRYFIGDVRDKDRVKRALEDVDVVIHAAAMKQVPASEYNPFECIKTNIIGAQNIIEGCLETNVSKVVALSTDKAAAAINLYGATKLASDKLFTAANNMVGSRELNFSVVRYGNVMGSRGSVMPFFLDKKKTGILTITDPEMTRFNISLEDGVKLVMNALEIAKGGEIFIPKIPSYKITDVANAIAPECRQEITGIRPGEKQHEEMITLSDSINTVDLGEIYAILPSSSKYSHEQYCEMLKAKPVPNNFSYNSGSNPDFLNVDEIRDLVMEFVDHPEAKKI